MSDLDVKTKQVSICKVCKKNLIYNSLATKGKFCSYQCYWSSKKGVITKNAKLFKKGEHASKATEFKKGSKGNFKNATLFSTCSFCNKRIKHFQSIKRKFCSYNCYWEDKKLNWDQKEYKDKAIKAVLKGLLKRPTSLEQETISLFSKYNLPYKYVGDGELIIGGKNPDFVNINGEKKLIEVGNVYHHQGNYIQERKEHFAKYGWETYVFIGDQLNEKQILSELKK